MSDPKVNPVEDALVADAKSSQIQLAKEDTSGGTILGRLLQCHCCSMTHKFWETQPVGQFKDIQDTSLPEGPIEPATLVSEVKQEPYNLLGQFEWTICDVNSDDVCSEMYNFLKENNSEGGYIKYNYSREYLRWALCPPGYYQSWHIGVRVKTSKKLVAFISGVPTRIRMRDEVVKMAKINFLCVHKKLRSKGLAPLMIKELTRRVHLQSIWQAAYTSRHILSRPVTSCRYWVRMLNPKKLIDAGLTRLRDRMTMSRTVKLYKLPDAPITPGFREMERRDVPAVTELLKNYLCQFGVATDFDENDVKHWLLPRENIIDSYLVVSPETHDVTDFCSFYTNSTTIPGNRKYTTVKGAYSYCNVSTLTSLPQLMNDALIVSKQKGFDVFYASDVMQNESFLKELRFYPGCGQVHYYLYNYRLRNALKPSELGIVL
ncbi:Acyl-CoA N-acyltransferase [Arabidopsis thaliana x Arabidopsis arenosa]|uniref:Glycylpeptide N-tetradecanoyltransferase n=1 Tax=Arabidopsis thaliana x Arabidopsis arenosa TaxID=1240361 RepID=A0A8T2ABU4_9BRAS|nr:Acyl-CoA N-acyltransferase [Arabidopsis thaliana x Arabidopsis arenosa]